jgi:hypothetical protein
MKIILSTNYNLFFLLQAEFTLANFVGKNIGKIADIFACLTCLDHTPQIETILSAPNHPRKSRQTGTG